MTVNNNFINFLKENEDIEKALKVFLKDYTFIFNKNKVKFYFTENINLITDRLLNKATLIE